jgi:predicted dehydrogenase
MSDQSRRDFLKIGGAGLIAAAAGANAFGAEPPTTTPLTSPDKQPPDIRIPSPAKKKIGWAVVGLGRLALGQIMPAFKESRLSRPVALVSGHPDKAKKVAELYGVDPKSIYNYENYDSIKDNPEIEAVYVVLPNSMHAEYTIRAARAGKHVLCEKPMCANVAEAKQMIDACKSAAKKLMIAYRLHYEPYNQAAIEMCQDNTFGRIIQIEASNVQNTRPPNIRLSKQLAGGPLGDIGVYCINACRYLTGEDPVEASGYSYQPKDEARFAEVPRDVIFTLHFPSGVSAHCGVSFAGAASKRYRVECADGWIDMDKAYGYSGQELRTMQQNKVTKVDLSPLNHFAAEMDHFSQCILDDKESLTPGEMGLKDMQIIAAIEESAASARRVKIDYA